MFPRKTKIIRDCCFFFFKIELCVFSMLCNLDQAINYTVVFSKTYRYCKIFDFYCLAFLSSYGPNLHREKNFFQNTIIFHVFVYKNYDVVLEKSC